MNKLSIGSRFLLFTAILLIAVVFALSAVTVNRTEQTLRGAEREQLELYYEQILARLELEGLAAQTMSALVAGIPAVQEAFAKGDREQLSRWFAPGFKQLKSEYGVEQFQFHTPPATSFLRVHKSEKFGDDLSSFRQTVVETNRNRQPIRGLESGVAGLGIRGVVPVSHQQKHIGSVEFGLSFGQKFFDQYKHDQGVDVALHLRDGDGFKPFGTTFGPDGGLLDAARLRQALKGEAIADRAVLRGLPVAVYANVVKDYSGKPVGVLELAADRTFFADELAGIRNSILGIGLLALVIAVAVAFVMARGVARPLLLAARNLEEIAQGGGDLSRRLPVEGSDELARLAGAFNRFIELIAGIVGSVSASAARLSSVVDGFSASATHTHNGMQNQQSETEQIAAAVNQMSATVHEVANNTNLAAAAAGEADKQTVQGQKVVNSAIAAIQAVAHEVERVSEVISRVDNDSTRIGSVLNVIGDIAEQTNLLALNAAIEAARAGDQGRGFAVVADEVRVLAQRTQKSTEEIREMIESLQKSAKTAVTVMVDGRTRTLESVEQARAAGAALNAIARAVDTINQMNTQIATASEEQSAVADEINRNIARISDVTDRTARESADTARESVRLVELAEELSRLVRQFRLGGSADLGRDLEAAKAAHLAWKVKLRTMLDGESSLSQSQAVSDRECAFGRWYFADGLAQLGHIREMKEIQAPHAEMHALIKRIIALKNDGKRAEAEREYAKVEPLSKRIVALIEAIKRQAS